MKSCKKHGNLFLNCLNTVAAHSHHCFLLADLGLKDGFLRPQVRSSRQLNRTLWRCVHIHLLLAGCSFVRLCSYLWFGQRKSFSNTPCGGFNLKLCAPDYLGDTFFSCNITFLGNSMIIIVHKMLVVSTILVHSTTN